jgi:hypothetical protein
MAAAKKTLAFDHKTHLMEEFTLDSWHLTKPNLSDLVVFVPAFKHAIQRGHFFLSGTTLIGRIIGISMNIGDVVMKLAMK